MNKAAKRRVYAVVFIAIAAMYAARLYEVNNGFTDYPKVAFDKAETATYATTGKDRDSKLEAGDIEVRVLSFKGLSFEKAKELYGEDDPYLVIQSSNGHEGELFTVEISVENRSKTDTNDVFVGSYELASISWKNGLYLPLFSAVNESNSNETVTLSLSPQEEKRVVLPYCAYDFQFGNKWKKLNEREFSLVLSMQPEMYYIKIGRFEASG